MNNNSNNMMHTSHDARAYLLIELRASNSARERVFARARNKDLTSLSVKHMIIRIYGTFPRHGPVPPPLGPFVASVPFALNSCCRRSLCILWYTSWSLKFSEVRKSTSQASETGLLSSQSIICILAQFVGLGSKVMFLDSRFACRQISLTRSVFFGDRN